MLTNSQPLPAQSSGTGALTGTVTDPSSAVVPNVTVTLTNNDTGQVRTITTGADGAYRFALIPPGTYKVRFSAGGFKVAEVPSVTVNVSETPVLNQALEVGQQAESVVVQAEAAVLQTADSTLGNVVSGNTITELPLATRNYTQILGLEAGANSGVNNGAAFGKATLDMAVNGAAPTQNNFQMDGASIINAFGAGSAADSGIYVGIPIPQPDAIGEFKVQTSTYDASYGRNPGANVNLVTKSGTNQFHGTLFEFFRNEDLNANSFMENLYGRGQQQVLKNNQFGGTFGGPVKKDKLFFFGAYQGTRQRNGVSTSGTSATILPPIPAGDRSAPGFQASLGSAFCAANHPGNSNYSTFASLFGGMQIACDGSNISPVALKILQVKNANGSYYIPGSATGDYQRVQYSSPAIYTGDQYIGNFDYLISSKHTLQGRYLFSEDPQTTPFGSSVPGTPVSTYYANTIANLKLTSLISNDFVNVAKIAYQRNIANGSDSTNYTPQGVGITPIVPQQTQPPVMVILNSVSIGGTLAPYYGPANQFNYSDQISWTHGKHNIRAGVEYEDDQWNLSFKSLLRGFLFIPGFDDFLLGRAGCTTPGCGPSNPGNTTGAPFGTYLFCLFCVRSGPDGIIHGYREHDVAGFVQDDWKINRNLTLNLGVRWEYDGMLGDHYGNLTNIWPSLLQTVPIPPSSPQPSGDSLVGYVVPNNYTAHYGQPPAGVTMVSGNNPTHNGIPHNNLGPRFGFAWQPVANGKFVVRGGLGFFYDRVGSSDFVHAVEQGDPYALTLDFSGPNATPYSLANPFPSTPLGFTPRYFNFATGANSALNAPFYSDVHTPLSRQYNLNVQYQFAPRWLLEVGFVGSSGINQTDYNHDYNVAQLASPSHPINGVTTNTAANASYRVQYLGYAPGQLQGTGYDGVYNYNSLQVTLRKQFSNGFTMQAAYTWSKDLTTIGQGTAQADVNANSNLASSLGQQYGPALFSRPQRFVVNYSYDLPFGNPSSKLLNRAVKGWTIAGVTVVQGGVPMTITDTAGGTVYVGGTANAGSGESGTSRVQMCPGYTYGQIATSGGLESRLGGAAGGPGYFNQKAFCAPPIIGSDGVATDYGNSGQGIILSPGQFNFDATLRKVTKITETKTLEFRVDSFNLFNHPQFGAPGVRRDTASTFGVINSVSTNPRLLQLALKLVF
ncbi:MAG: carboxypeptidase regulatory-like domain-containing protein [Acidobacteriia bacterium]|nr:carboxypeptidase regulatory-like domain-containing protein [Terriglobia bacterium]